MFRYPERLVNNLDVNMLWQHRSLWGPSMDISYTKAGHIFKTHLRQIYCIKYPLK